MVLFGTLLKSVSAIGFQGKAAFLASVFFHSQMLGVTNFGLVIYDCTVIAMIFIEFFFVKLPRISFNELLKIHIIIILVRLKKVCLAFFLQNRLKILRKTNLAQTRWPFWKNLQCVCLGFFILHNYIITFEKKSQGFYYLRICPENLNFRRVVFFTLRISRWYVLFCRLLTWSKCLHW